MCKHFVTSVREMFTKKAGEKRKFLIDIVESMDIMSLVKKF